MDVNVVLLGFTSWCQEIENSVIYRAKSFKRDSDGRGGGTMQVKQQLSHHFVAKDDI